MKLLPQRLSGIHLIEVDYLCDERGFFARSYCTKELSAAGIDAPIAQCNISSNTQKGIIRGLHYQKAPFEEGKIVRCTKGKIFDVCVDLRPDSDTYCQWLGFELTEDNHKALYIPKGFAHGFQTLSEQTEILYLMTEYYEASASTGVRWNDTTFAIDWPLSDPLLSDRDANYPNFTK